MQHVGMSHLPELVNLQSILPYLYPEIHIYLFSVEMYVRMCMGTHVS